jgi:hypothetical protein
MLVTYR